MNERHWLAAIVIIGIASLANTIAIIKVTREMGSLQIPAPVVNQFEIQLLPEEEVDATEDADPIPEVRVDGGSPSWNL